MNKYQIRTTSWEFLFPDSVVMVSFTYDGNVYKFGHACTPTGRDRAREFIKQLVEAVCWYRVKKGKERERYLHIVKDMEQIFQEEYLPLWFKGSDDWQEFW